MVYNASLDYPFEEVFLTVEDQCNDRAEAGPQSRPVRSCR